MVFDLTKLVLSGTYLQVLHGTSTFDLVGWTIVVNFKHSKICHNSKDRSCIMHYNDPNCIISWGLGERKEYCLVAHGLKIYKDN